MKTRTKNAKTTKVGGGKKTSRSTTLGQDEEGIQSRASNSRTVGEGSQSRAFISTNPHQTTNNPFDVQQLGFTTKDKAIVTSMRNPELARKKNKNRIKTKACL